MADRLEGEVGSPKGGRGGMGPLAPLRPRSRGRG